MNMQGHLVNDLCSPFVPFPCVDNINWIGVSNKNIVIILVLVKGATETYLNDPEQQQKD